MLGVASYDPNNWYLLVQTLSAYYFMLETNIPVSTVHSIHVKETCNNVKRELSLIGYENHQ